MSKEPFGKSGEQVQHLGPYLIFVGPCKGCHFVRQARKPVTRNVPDEHLGQSGEQVKHLGGGLFDFWRGLKGMSFCKACPQTCHEKCAQATFWKKWGAGPAPEGTYLIFVGS